MAFPFTGNLFPNTDYNKINLDWILDEMKQDREDIDEIKQELEDITVDIPDGSITSNKLDPDLLLQTVNVVVSPEMFGAVGDGITDDTQAWQDAVDSGFPVVANSGVYKCGIINVTKNTTIDCNNAVFVCTGAKLFNCTGAELNTISNAASYTANDTGYTISDYTGRAILKGTNNLIPYRAHYRAGIIGFFHDGVLLNTFDANITTPDIVEYSPITCTIKNIKDAIFGSDGIVVDVKYGAACVFENINCSYAVYSLIHFNTVDSSIIDKCSNIQPLYTGSEPNTYTILFENCFYNIVRNCVFTNPFWDCFSTGGVYLSYSNTVQDSVLLGRHAIDDHENGLRTIVKNCICSAITLSGMAELRDSIVVSATDSAQTCRIDLLGSIMQFAKYRVENVKMYPASDISTSGTVGILLRRNPVVANTVAYFNDVLIKDVICCADIPGNNDEITFNNVNNDADSIVVGNVVLDNVNFNITCQRATVDNSNAVYTVRNIRQARRGLNGRMPQLNNPQGGSVCIEHCKLYFISGSVPTDMNFIDLTLVATTELKATGMLTGSNIKGQSITITQPDRVTITNMQLVNQSRTYIALWRIGTANPIYCIKVVDATLAASIFYQP